MKFIAKLFKRLSYFFIQGLFYISPIGVTIFVIYQVFMYFDKILDTTLPGLGILVVLVSITLIGWLSVKVIYKPTMKYFEKIIQKTPVVKLIYTSVKDIVSAFIGQKKKFNQPVLVKMADTGLERIGFIMEENLQVIGIEGNKVAVYFPMSISIAGDLFIVPVENISKIDMPAADVMKFIISGGLTS